MGDPRHQGKKYDTPSHPWQEERMERETRLIQKYGLKNKKEFWRSESELRKYRRKARELLADLGGAGSARGAAEQEAEELQTKLRNLGMLSEGEQLDDVLSLGVRDLLDRRLQTVVYRKGLAKTPKHARQLIVHGHISVDGRKVTIPSYKTDREEENTVQYREESPYDEELHPEAA